MSYLTIHNPILFIGIFALGTILWSPEDINLIDVNVKIIGSLHTPEENTGSGKMAVVEWISIDSLTNHESAHLTISDGLTTMVALNL